MGGWTGGKDAILAVEVVDRSLRPIVFEQERSAAAGGAGVARRETRGIIVRSIGSAQSLNGRSGERAIFSCCLVTQRFSTGSGGQIKKRE